LRGRVCAQRHCSEQAYQRTIEEQGAHYHLR